MNNVSTSQSKSQNTKSTAASTLKTVDTPAADTFSSAATGIVSSKTTKQSQNGKDLRNFYCDRTKEAFDQFSKYTRFVQTDQLDLRCEFDLPRRKDLIKMIPFTNEEDHANFIWMQTAHDFSTPSNPEVERSLRSQIVNLTIQELKAKEEQQKAASILKAKESVRKRSVKASSGADKRAN